MCFDILCHRHIMGVACGRGQLFFPFIYIRKNAQVVTSLQTSCNKSVHNLCSHCLFLVCCDKFGASC